MDHLAHAEISWKKIRNLEAEWSTRNVAEKSPSALARYRNDMENLMREFNMHKQNAARAKQEAKKITTFNKEKNEHEIQAFIKRMK